MEHIALPDKFEVKNIGDHHAEITIEPCFPGFGTTLGNALRRVLLSSLNGAAITAVHFKGATHEFSTIPGVKEDVVEILLNLKKIRFKLHGTDEAKATLKVKGEKKVKAKDFKTTSDTEVISSDAEIATITDKDADFELEVTINTGRGYVPVENMDNKKLSLGTIAVDAIYTPVRNVNFNVENVRVGQMTNYDKVVLNILTDGTITPEDSIKIASQILVDHFSHIAAFGKTIPEIAVAEATEEAKGDDIEKETVEKEKDAEKPKKKRGRPKKEQ